MIKAIVVMRHNRLLYFGSGLTGAGIDVILETALFPTTFINNLLGVIIFTILLVSGLVLIYMWKKQHYLLKNVVVPA